MDLPKYHETFLPILSVLAAVDSLHQRDLAIRVREKYYSSLPKDVLAQKTVSGTNVLFDRISWGKSYLKIAKFVDYPQRGFVKITDKGKLILKKGRLSLEDIKKDIDFVVHQENRKSSENRTSDDVLLSNSSPQDLIDLGYTNIENQVKTDLLERLKEIDPYYFEKVVLLLLHKMGYGEFLETAKSRDGGIDGIISEDKLGLGKIYIQAKRYGQTKVHEKEIRNFLGAMSGDTTKGVFVTTSSFDDLAIKKAREAHHKIVLIDGEKLVDLMHQYGVGVQTSRIYEVKEIDEDFFER